METAGPGPARDTGPGSRRIFTLGLAVFGAASAACGLAPTLSVLVAARLLPAPQPRPRAVDLGGQVLAITGLGALLAGDERAPREFETGLGGQSGPVPNPEQEGPMSAAAIVVIVVVVAVVVLAVMMPMARRRRLQRRFGPEYDRVVTEKQSRRKGEAELAGRERRVQSLGIQPLTATARASYATEWTTIQERFVDQPQQAVTEAQRLVVSVMSERGYPAEEPAQVMADLSVEHASTLSNFRMAQEISQNAPSASTEELRQAMVHYRALFTDLLGQPDEVQASVTEDSISAARVPAGEPGIQTAPRARR